MQQPEVALLTGCGSGIGRALALELDRRRRPDGSKAFTVNATDISIDALAELRTAGISVFEMDVTMDSSVKAVVSKILSISGHIDLLVCNAGVSMAGWIVETPVESVQKTFEVNVLGALRVVQAVAPSMMERRSGKIATMCSVTSWVCKIFAGTYASSKAALAMMTEAMRLELEPFGVQVVSVVPGWVRTHIMKDADKHPALNSPDSHYWGIMDKIREQVSRMQTQGITAEQAATDIADGLSKPKPPRYVYTGTHLRYALFMGFLQTWVCPNFVAKLAQEDNNLHLTEKLGRRKVDTSSASTAKSGDTCFASTECAAANGKEE